MSGIDLSNHSLNGAAPDQCFLCGKRFPDNELTREHVFPKWLQRKLRLWDRQLTLLNGTLMRYRQLTIPACTTCNGISLSRIEAKVARALPGGADAVRALGHETLYVWLSKLFFGTLYAEALLPFDKAARQGRAILPNEVLGEFEYLHLMMQAARTTIHFHSGETNYHASILVFPVQQHPERAQRFMYRDDLNYGCIAVRLDTVGLICVMDGGAQERFAGEVFPRLFHHNLHPLQFEELTAKVFMKARTFQRTPKYVTSMGAGATHVIQMPLSGISEKPVFGEWDQEMYGRMLADFTHHPFDFVYRDDGTVVTWIGSYHEPLALDVRDRPWP